MVIKPLREGISKADNAKPTSINTYPSTIVAGELTTIPQRAIQAE